MTKKFKPFRFWSKSYPMNIPPVDSGDYLVQTRWKTRCFLYYDSDRKVWTDRYDAQRLSWDPDDLGSWQGLAFPTNQNPDRVLIAEAEKDYAYFRGWLIAGE